MKVRFGESFHPYFSAHPFVLVDVGARGGLKKEWLPLERYLKLVAFEPDPEECERMRERVGAQRDRALIYNTALWSEKKNIPLHITKNPGFSSVYLPDDHLLSSFDAANTAGYVVMNRIEMAADKLDDAVPEAERRSFDFIKVDAEGCASDVLTGAEDTLAEGAVAGLQIEAEFNPKYKGQTLFHDVDRVLRKHHYQLFLAETCSWKRKAGLKTGGAQGQLMHADLSYFLELDQFFLKIASMDKTEQISRVLKFCCFLCLYGVYDLAFELLGHPSTQRLLPEELTLCCLKELNKTTKFLFRIPKLERKGFLCQCVYHLLMLCGGALLKRSGYWDPQVSLD